MQLSVLTTSITEPVTHDEVKSFMGFPASDTSQDTTIDNMITVAREWVEQRTGLSLVSKSYKAYFDKEDAEDGWYDLPVSPVLTLPVITAEMSGVSITFEQVGSKRVRIRPDTVMGTIPIGGASGVSYLEVTFQAGATNKTANQCILSVVSSMFNYREGGVNVARIPFDTLSLIDSISVNL